jgi:hypothetical protein
VAPKLHFKDSFNSVFIVEVDGVEDIIFDWSSAARFPFLPLSLSD